MYAREENNKIKVYAKLPREWKNIINFPKTEDVSEFGFYPFIQEKKSKYQKYGDIEFVDSTFIRIIIDMTQDEIDLVDKNERDSIIEELEAKGVDVEYNEHIFHFSRDLASQFLGVAQLTEKLGSDNMDWKNNKGVFVNIPVADAYIISATALTLFKNIHLEN